MSTQSFRQLGLFAFANGAGAPQRQSNTGGSSNDAGEDQETTLALPSTRSAMNVEGATRESELQEDETTRSLPPPASLRRLATVPSAQPIGSRAPGRVEPGTLLGNYRILRCIARGGMASVWVASHRSARGLSKVVTLKTILPELAADPSFEAMFVQEARLASLIHHPNVCETFELIDIDGVLALSMEWVDGASLSRMLSASTAPLDARIAARIAAQAAAGLHAAHELCDEQGRPMKLVHRDVSPQNILLSRDGHVRISDFGIAKAMCSLRNHSPASLVQGKAAYLSPEQSRDEPLDRRSDIFSLGAVLYLAAVGRRPFARRNLPACPAQLRPLQWSFAPPLQVNPSLPPPLAAIIERAMATDPLRRYQTAAEMRHELELWLSTSGPLVAEQDVARILDARCGDVIEHQQKLIRVAISWEREARQGEATRTGEAQDPTESAPRGPTESGTLPSAALRERRAPARSALRARGLSACLMALAAALPFGVFAARLPDDDAVTRSSALRRASTPRPVPSMGSDDSSPRAAVAVASRTTGREVSLESLPRVVDARVVTSELHERSLTPDEAEASRDVYSLPTLAKPSSPRPAAEEAVDKVITRSSRPTQLGVAGKPSSRLGPVERDL